MEKKLINLSVSFLSEMNNHRANCGDKFLGNESLVKKHKDFAYISAQSFRRNLLDTMENINRGYNETYFTTSDSGIDVENPNLELQKNIAFDFRGILLPHENSFKRYSTFKTNHNFSVKKSDFYFDLLLSFSNVDSKHNIVRNEISYDDMIQFNASLDVERILALDTNDEQEISEKSIRIIKKIIPAFDDVEDFTNEKKRRIILFLKSIENLHGFANQSRNLVDPTPKEMFVVFNHITQDNKFLNFFNKSPEDRIELLNYCKSNNIDYLIYDKLLLNNNHHDLNLSNSIYQVFDMAIKKLDDFDLTI